MPEKAGVFVSHHHNPNEDEFTERLVDDFEAAGAKVWVDVADISDGDFMERINAALASSDWLVLVMTPASLRSPAVRMEVNAALNLVLQGRMRGIIPVVAEKCEPTEIPPTWANLQRYDATKGYKVALTGLLRALGLPSPAQVTQTPILPASTQSKSRPRVQRAKVVDASGGGDYCTIKEALQKAQPRDRIVVRPGIYAEALTLDKPLELVGEGDRDVIVIELSHDLLTNVKGMVLDFSYPPVVRVCATGVHLINLSVRARPRGFLSEAGDALLVESGGELRMEDCDITTSAQGNSGVWVKSGKATLIHTHIHDCGLSGVVLENSQAKAVLEDNTIDNCGLFSPSNSITGAPFPAVRIKSGAEVTAKGNLITNNAGVAVRLEGRGKGVFQDNDLRSNQKGAWDIDKRSLPNVQRFGNHE